MGKLKPKKRTSIIILREVDLTVSITKCARITPIHALKRNISGAITMTMIILHTPNSDDHQEWAMLILIRPRVMCPTSQRKKPKTLTASLSKPRKKRKRNRKKKRKKRKRRRKMGR